MSTKIQQNIAAAIEEAYPMPDRIAALVRMATEDLFSGPCDPFDGDDADDDDTEGHYPGWESALREIESWLDYGAGAPPMALYYNDDSGCLMESEPEGEYVDMGDVDDDGEPVLVWCDPAPYYLVERREIKAALFGSELGQYVNR